ncbi:glycosyltransferase family 2 protein [Neokomagataea anthophila]|uniref:Glycosyltransferase n=1 Tax=Neokomagataea anthophila TaxID=2826925 RepID=A0ABS5E5R7_9PROT|nr:glycosyltransferase [Neokomagataea anthophila]MBR0559258.1 glycosyltransferase [Neokomagataea anthophila]
MKYDNIKLGIGVITYNRKSIVTNTIQHIKKYTETPFSLIIADDGSSDGTIDILHTMGIQTINGSNRGIAWNKNRVIFYLKEIIKCDVIIILEDDCFPTSLGWERAWIDAAQRWGHINLFPNHWDKSHIISGSGSPADPYIFQHLTGQCEAFTQRALNYVGYLDTRFRSYGFEHVEHTHRFIRAGFGGTQSPDGTFYSYLIKSDLEVTCLDKAPDWSGITHNSSIFLNLKNEPIYRPCWRNDAELAIFRSEIATYLPEEGTAQWPLSNFEEYILVWHNDTATITAQATPNINTPVINAFIQGRSARLGFYDNNDNSLTWIEIDTNNAIKTTKHAAEATIFEAIYTYNDKLNFMHNNLFLCCDLNKNRHVECSRQIPSDWETFTTKF